MLEICKKLFDKWNKEVRYCHWKGNDHIIDGLIGKGDLDIFVLPDDKSIAESSLQELKFIKVRQQKFYTYPLVDEWIGFDYKTGSLVHVHLHYQLVTGTDFCKEYVFPWDNMIIDTRCIDKTGIFVPTRELELIMFYMRTALKAKDKKHIVPRKHKDGFHFLKDRCEKDKIRLFLNKLFPEKANAFYKLISKPELSYDEWYEVYLIASSVLKDYKKLGGIRVFIRHNYYKIYHRLVSFLNQHFGANFILKKRLPHSGLSICFIGVDGSGKSTVSKDISKWLSWKLDTHSFYLGSGDGYNSLLRKSMKFIVCIKNALKRNNIKGHSQDQIMPSRNFNSDSKKVSYSLSNVLFSCFYSVGVAKHCRKELKKAKKYQSDGGIAIYDRFPQNQFFGIYDGPKVMKNFGELGYSWVKLFSRKEERIISECQNFQPTIVFKLAIAFDESVRRKGDSEEIIKEKVEITQKLKFPNSEIHIIDAMQDYNEELLNIKRLIWTKINAK